MSDTDAIKNLQRWLNSRGADLGVDGLMGPKTRAAIKTFEQNNGLPVTGEISDRLIAALTAPQQRPNMRNPADVPGPDVLGSGNTNMMPRQRPPGEALAQGNTSMVPRLREDIPVPTQAPTFDLAAAGPPPELTPPAPPPPPADIIRDAHLADAQRINPDVQFNPGATGDMIFRNAEYGNTRQLAANNQWTAPQDQGGMGMSGPRGPTDYPLMTGGVPDFTAGGNAGNGLPAPSQPQPQQQYTDAQRMVATAVLRDALGQMQQPPPAQGWQPTDGQQGYGLPGLPAYPTFWDAMRNMGGLGTLFGSAR